MSRLERFCQLLNSPNLKSKQKAVDMCFLDLTLARTEDGYSWGSIVEHINENSEEKISPSHLMKAYNLSKKRQLVAQVPAEQKKENSAPSTRPAEKTVGVLEPQVEHKEKEVDELEAPQSKFAKHLNDPSRLLIKNYDLTDDDLVKAEITGRYDTMVVYNLIRVYCEKIKYAKDNAFGNELLRRQREREKNCSNEQ